MGARQYVHRPGMAVDLGDLAACMPSDAYVAASIGIREGETVNRISCLLLGLVAGSATAGSAQSWVELQYGETSLEMPAPGHSGLAFHPRSDENHVTGLSAAWASSSTLYWRVDHRRIQRDMKLPSRGPGDVIDLAYTEITEDTVIPPDAWDRVQEREFTTLTVGFRRTEKAADLFGEVGVARMSFSDSSLHHSFGDDVTDAGNYTVAAFSREYFEYEHTSAFARGGIVVERDALSWGGGIDWYQQVQKGYDRGTGEWPVERQTWLNAYIGWRFTPDGMLSFQYARNDEFAMRGLALRWTP